MSGAEIATEVAAALAEVGDATGDGPLIGTLFRKGVEYGSEHSPSMTDPTPHAVTLVIDEFTLMEQAQNSVEIGDKKLLMAADGLAITPSTEDWLEVGDVEYTIENIVSLEPGGVAVMYTIQARRRIVEEQYGT